MKPPQSRAHLALIGRSLINFWENRCASFAGSCHLDASGLFQQSRPTRNDFDVVQNTLALVSDILLARVDTRFPVPEGDVPLDQSRVDQTASALRHQSLLVDTLEVPARTHLVNEVSQQRSRIVGGRESDGGSSWAWSAWRSRGKGPVREERFSICLGCRSSAGRGAGSGKIRRVQVSRNCILAGGWNRDASNKVHRLSWIGLQVEQHWRINEGVYELPASAANHNYRGQTAFTHVLPQNSVCLYSIFASNIGHQRHSIQGKLGDRLRARHVHKGG